MEEANQTSNPIDMGKEDLKWRMMMVLYCASGRSHTPRGFNNKEAATKHVLLHYPALQIHRDTHQIHALEHLQERPVKVVILCVSSGMPPLSKCPNNTKH